MKKSILIKALAIVLALMCVLPFASCDVIDFNDPKDLENMDKDLEKKEASKGLAFKSAKDNETGETYYSVSGMGECKDTVVIIPDSYEGAPVKKILNNAFQNTDIERVYIPETVTSIAHHAFAGCEKLTNVKLPDSLTALSSDVFADCTSLANVYFGSGIKKIGSRAFSNCTSLEVAYLPASLEELGEGVFQKCSSLKKVSFDGSLEEISDSSFQDCTALTEIKFPADVKIIGLNAFRGCVSLTKVEIPETVTQVKDYAFMRCINLQSIYIPASVKKWGNFVTYYCGRLETMKYGGTKAQWEKIECISKREDPNNTSSNEIIDFVVNPNQNLSMYLSIIATHVECTDGTFDIKEIVKENGMEAGDLDKLKQEADLS